MHPADRRRLPHKASVEPAATAFAPCGRAEFVAARAKAFTIFVIQLGRERAFADAGGVGFHDAQHEMHGIGTKARARRGLSGDHVRGRDKGIGAKVDVQQSALCAFEQDALALPLGGVELFPDRAGVGQDLRCDFTQLGQQRVTVDLFKTTAPAQCVVMHQSAVDPTGESFFVGQIGHADDPATHLVLIGRADAAAGGADLGDAVLRLARAVQLAVDRQDQRCVLGDHQRLGRDRHPLPAQLRDFLFQVPGVQHHTVADHGQLATAHDARGQQAQLEYLAVNNQRVTCIMPTLETRDHIGTFGQPVHDLAFSLVAPLGADNDDISHDELPLLATGLPIASKWPGRNWKSSLCFFRPLNTLRQGGHKEARLLWSAAAQGIYRPKETGCCGPTETTSGRRAGRFGVSQ